MASGSNMRNLMILTHVIVLVLSSPAVAANKCKFEKNGVDSFTRQMVVETKWKSFRSFGNQAANHGWMAARSENDTQFLGLKVVVVDYDSARPEGPNLHENRVLIPQSAKLLVLLADDTILELVASAKARGKSSYTVPGEQMGHPDFYVVKTTAVVWYELTADMRGELIAQGATDIRLSASNKDHDFTFGKKPTDRIQYVVGCIQ